MDVQTEDLETRADRLAARIRAAGKDVTFDHRVDTSVAAELLGVTIETLANWRADSRVKLLRHVRCGRLISYYLVDLIAFIDSRTGYD